MFSCGMKYIRVNLNHVNYGDTSLIINNNYIKYYVIILNNDCIM